MTTVVNNPPSNDSGSGMGMMIGLVMFVALGYLFFVYGLPALRQTQAPQINIPDKINVNIEQTK